MSEFIHKVSSSGLKNMLIDRRKTRIVVPPADYVRFPHKGNKYRRVGDIRPTWWRRFFKFIQEKIS